MAPMIHTAAVCLVALSAVHSVRAALPTAVAAPAAVITNINLARTGKLSVLIPVVATDSATETAVIAALPALAGDGCPDSATTTSTDASGFVFSYPFDTASPDFATLMNTALHAGLDALTTLPTEMWGAGLWSTNDAVNNIGYLLWQKSTKVGCAVTQCTAAANLVLCRFAPGPVVGDAPFSAEYFTAIKARTQSLADMTAADINDGSSTGGGGSSGTMAVPSVLVVGIIAMMFTTSG